MNDNEICSISLENFKNLSADHFVGDVPIEKGTYLNVYSIPNHHNPKHFKDPQEFRPERW